ncbi:hypothetical protein Javan384_0046 [Streptococcus phage Javan384]|nr:hypothetical protein Javan384_0046 [Streptococcus phage Javan384]
MFLSSLTIMRLFFIDDRGLLCGFGSIGIINFVIVFKN